MQAPHPTNTEVGCSAPAVRAATSLKGCPPAGRCSPFSTKLTNLWRNRTSYISLSTKVAIGWTTYLAGISIATKLTNLWRNRTSYISLSTKWPLGGQID